MNKLEFLRALITFSGGTVCAIFVLLSGCGPESSTKQAKLEKSLSTPKTNVLTPDKILITKKTRQTYQWYCAQCHGEKGQGDGINAPYLVVLPRDHTKAAYLEIRSNQQLFEAIKLGGLAVGRAPCMPAWGHTLDDKTIRSLVSYIRDLCNCEAL